MEDEKFVENLLEKCAVELGMDLELPQEKQETEEQKQMKKIKEWLREGTLSENNIGKF